MNKSIILLVAFVSLTFGRIYGQNVTNFPYFESFEGLGNSGWTIYNPEGDEAEWIKTDASFFVKSGFKSIYHGYYSNPGNPQQTGWLISPKIILPTDVSQMLSFWSIDQFAGSGKNSVLISTTGNNPNTDTFVEVYATTTNFSEEWKNIFISLSEYAGQSIYIAFRYEATAQRRWYLDDVSVAHLPDSDAGVIALTSPASGANLTSTEPITVIVKNFGAKPLTNIPVRVEIDGALVASGTVTGPVASRAEVSYTLPSSANLSGVRSYSIKAYTVLNGEENTENDTITTQVINYGNCNVSVFPFVEGFEDERINACWTIYNYNLEPSNPTWTIRTYLTRTGEKSILHSYGSLYQNGWLVTPKMVLTNDVYMLSFWSNNRPGYPTPYGKNTVWISDGSMDPADGDYVKMWSPASVKAEWEETLINLKEYAGKEIYIAFQYEGTNAHDWSIDDVSIYQLPHYDTGVTAVVSPQRGLNLGVETVSVTVKNFGSETVTNIPIRFEVNGQIIATETIPGPIASLTESHFTFDTPADLSTVQKYTIKAYTTLTGDEHPENDAINAPVVNYGNGIISTFPHTEGFEDDDDLFLWTQEGQLPWTFIAGSEGGVFKDFPHSGLRNAYFYSFFSNNTTKLITPRLNISALGAPVLKFWYGKEKALGGGWDILRVYYKNSANGSWIKLFEELSLVTEWTEKVIDLPNPSTEYFLAFEGFGNVGDGIVLDDITVTNSVNKDAMILAVTNPVNGPNLTNAETVTVKLKNFGLETLTNIPVQFKVDGQIVGKDTVPGPVSTFQEIDYTFRAKANLLEERMYRIEAYTALNGDENLANDTVVAWITNYGNKAIMGTESSFTTCDVTFVDDGVDDEYARSWDDLQITTFYPETQNKRIRVDFERFALYPDEIFQGVFFPGDSLYIYEGSVVNENNRIAALSDDLNANLPGPFISYAPDGALTFVLKKKSGFAAEGWEAPISCITPHSYDAGVKKILAPVMGGNAAAQVKVELKNYGGTSITSLDVAYRLMNGTQVKEHFTGNISPGETKEFTFVQTIDLSEVRDDYLLEAYTLLANDADTGNDSIAVHLFYRENVVLYGYRIFDGDQTLSPGMVSFNSNNPSEVTTINAYKDGTNQIFAGEYYNNNLYLYTVQGNANPIPAHFIQLKKDWTEGFKKTAQAYPWDMTYDYSTNTMIAEVWNGDYEVAELNAVDLNTGNMSLFAVSNNFFYALACHSNGQLYGVSISGDFCSIDKETGDFTVIGNTGVLPKYTQSMAFDHSSGRLFWAATNDSEGNLLEIDLTTGKVTDFGVIGHGAEIVALHIPYSHTGIETPETNKRSIVVYPNPTKGEVFISAVPENAFIRILDLSGRVVDTYRALSGDVKLDLNLASGIYFIQIENEGEKILRKLIIK
jgi:hypothetical protein